MALHSTWALLGFTVWLVAYSGLLAKCVCDNDFSVDCAMNFLLVVSLLYFIMNLGISLLVHCPKLVMMLLLSQLLDMPQPMERMRHVLMRVQGVFGKAIIRQAICACQVENV